MKRFWLAIFLALAAGCSAPSGTDVISVGQSSDGEHQSGSERGPMLCSLVEEFEKIPPEIRAKTLKEDGRPSMPRSDPQRSELALGIIRSMPGLAEALRSTSYELMFVTDVPKPVLGGVQVNINFDEPVSLPTDLGVPEKNLGEGSGLPALDEDGWPKRVTADDAVFRDVLSASFYVDLRTEAVRFAVPSIAHEYCWLEVSK